MIGATDDDDDVGFAWSGRWRRRDLRGRSINDGKFSSTDMVRLASLSPGAALNDQRNLAALLIFAALTRARARLGGAMPTDLLGPPGWCSVRFGADDGARVIGATDDDDDVGFAGSGRWRRRGATYGVDRSTMANSQALTWCAWLRSLRARL